MAARTQTVGELTTNAAKTTSSFIIRIVGTEHGSWQGRVEHIQSGTSTVFRSCLGMLNAMDRALQFKSVAVSDVDDSEMA